MIAFVIVSAVILTSNVIDGQECESVGFFRDPENCARFYRCVDLTGTGSFQTYFFDCPAGTVFDEGVSVCNFPWAAPPCEEEQTPDEEYEEVGGEEEDSNSETVIVTPQFGFECTAPGFFGHDSDCMRFWLCKVDPEENEFNPELYRCPEGFYYHDAIRRCLPKEEVSLFL